MSFFSFLPQASGLLPKWLLFISIVSVFNSAQTYISGLKMTKKVYSAQPQLVTPLSARTFGTWTLITAIVRLYGAYYINDPAVYSLTLATFWVALGHFATEWLVYKTTRLGSGLAGPFIVSTCSLFWMYNVRDFYN